MSPHPVNFIPKPHFISKSAIPTKQHCLRVKKLLKCPHRSSLIYMKGKEESTRDNTDVDLEFRQESNFFYLTGVEEAGFHVIFHLRSEKVYLITPDIPEPDISWKGPGYNPTELLEKFNIDEVINEAHLPELIQQLDCEVHYVLDEEQGIALAKKVPVTTINVKALLPALSESRLIKFDWEIIIIRQAMEGSSKAHCALMQQFEPGMPENHLAALFRWTCAQNGIYNQAYLPIVASGPRAATLHYTRNSQRIPDTPHTLVLVDAGGEKLCYSSDITRTFPAQGKFSKETKAIYDIVLKMQETVLSQLQPGVIWSEMQTLAIRVMLIELIKIGILKISDEEELEDLMYHGIHNAFYFHCLGHTVGLDVHDVGGRNQENYEFLKDRPLEKNMVLTVEPGLYFNDTMLNAWMFHQEYNKYFDVDMVNKYRVVGGVRIEDTIVITADGHENLTLVPKQTHEIEHLMSYRTHAF